MFNRMNTVFSLKPYPPVNTKNKGSVGHAIQEILHNIYPKNKKSIKEINNYFNKIEDIYNGKWEKYHSSDTPYHTFEHALQVTLCAIRIIEGAIYKNYLFRLKDIKKLILASLLHDIGYLKKNYDPIGTGAKHTHYHEIRSAIICGEYLGTQQVHYQDILSIQRLILATSVDECIDHIPFISKTELFLAKCLCTADIIAQLSDEEYPKKLNFLNQELNEATHNISINPSTNLLKTTPIFWKLVFKEKLMKHCSHFYKFLNRPHDSKHNPYLKAINKNLNIIYTETISTPAIHSLQCLTK